MKVPASMFMFFILFNVVGCSHEDSIADLKAYVQTIKSRPARTIEPLPEVKPYETFSYSAQDLRSPFMPPEPVEALDQVVASNGIRPNTERRKELLENYPLDTLRMVGTLERNGHQWAIVIDKDATVHRITIGNYIGQNHGLIEKISDEKIEIREIVTDARGGWQERAASMVLTVE